MRAELSNLDWGVIALYFAATFAVALYFFLQRKRKKEDQTNQYFMGGRNLEWWVIGASLFASNIGSEHLIGLAGAGAKGDFAAGQFEILASIILLFLGWFFVPFYMRSGVFTMPEFLKRRYNEWARGYLTWVSILGYVLTKISVTIFAGGLIFTTLLGIDFWTGAILIVLFTGIYTVIGGLKVVVYTDFIQMLVLLGGSITLTYFGLQELGGVSELKANTTPMHLSLWRDLNDSDFPWTGILFGAPILGVWYWCTDQFIVQRVISGKNIDAARKGTIFGAFLKLLPLFIFVIPGVIAYALSVGDNAILEFPMKNGKADYDAALPLLTMHILPNGLKGLVAAGLLAALMSSLSSVFNSCSTLFTMDIYRKYFPETSQKKLVKVGQIATAILVALGLLWIPLMDLIQGGLFQKIQSIQAYIAPPIAAVFLVGIFSRRITAKAAKASLIFGGVLGALRLSLEIWQEKAIQRGVDVHGAIVGFTEINFLHFAFILFVACTFLLFMLSKQADRKPLDEIELITYERGALKEARSRTNVLFSVLVVLGVLALWLIFR